MSQACMLHPNLCAMSNTENNRTVQGPCLHENNTQRGIFRCLASDESKHALNDKCDKEESGVKERTKSSGGVWIEWLEGSSLCKWRSKVPGREGEKHKEYPRRAFQEG